MNNSALVNLLKDNNQDHEFYPTTNEIIERFYFDLNGEARREYCAPSLDFLEIGCGNGKVFREFEKLSCEQKEAREKEDERRGYAALGECYGIEKSEILINQLPANIVIVGTDFWQQTLIDKKVDVVFCNPPYSEFEDWAVKIIKEASAKYIYLVIPQRWQESSKIDAAIKIREAKSEILGDYDFLEADRQARAKVNLIKIDLTKNVGYSRKEAATDPFEIWFDEEFKIKCDKKEDYSKISKEANEEEATRKSEINNEVAAGRDLVQVLASLYQRDLAKLILTYKSLESVDAELLKELNVKLDDVKKALRLKIKGLKKLYWKEIFNRLDKIKERLCSKQRMRLLNILNDNSSIDCTESNVYAVVIWVIKNANKYFDEQLVDLYQDLSTKDNIKNYKSNQKTWEQDNWRYTKETMSHYCLDYRLVLSRYRCFDFSFSGETRGLTSEAIALIDDLMTVAVNLGFDGQSEQSFGWNYNPNAGEKLEFHMRPNWRNDTTVKRTLFMEVRFYKNGNIHLKLNQDFIKALNIEAGRLLGWVKSANDVVEEFPDDCKVTPEDAGKYFKKNYLMICSNAANLLEVSI